MELKLHLEKWDLAVPFRITNHVFNDAEVLVITLRDGTAVGRGEAAGVYYRNDLPEKMVRQIESVRGQIEQGLDREALRALLPLGGARNALDCALWDMESKRAIAPVWSLADISKPVPLTTTFTVGAGAPVEMASAARSYENARALKLKLTPDEPLACVRAVRAAMPDVWLGVDANRGLTRAMLEKMLPGLVEARVALIEQPVEVGRDDELIGLHSPIPIAADESVQGVTDIANLVGRYDVVNIKLDKCGGLTEGLAMVREARRLGLKVMVGCMAGTSLAMAPAFVLGQLCDLVDLDAPTFLTGDREIPALYANGEIWCPEALWGGAN